MAQTDFLKQFSDFIQQKKLVAHHHIPIIVACSGGVDSVVLAFALNELNYSISLAHCNFKLRGKASDDDEVFVTQTAETLNVPCYTKVFNTSEIAKEQTGSIQMVARALRYQWFEELLQRQKGGILATAHHADDQVETVLFNLTKGSGIAGYRGMLAKRDLFIRPLLWATKEDILEYATEARLSWREDASNQKEIYHRNRIRHKVIPQLKHINPNLPNTVWRSTERLAATENLLTYFINQFKKEHVKNEEGETTFSTAALEGVSAKHLLLFSLIQPYGFTYSQGEKLAQTFTSTETKLFYSHSHQLTKERSEIIIKKRIKVSKMEKEVLIPNIEFEKIIELNLGTISLREIPVSRFKLMKVSSIGAFDRQKIKFPLTLRLWQTGDRFHPLGMRGTKLVSDLLMDRKTPLHEKQKVMVLVSQGEIIWVVGYQINEKFKVSQQTTSVLEVTLHKS